MDFGVLVPQGWRLDLQHIKGAAAKWDAVRRVSIGLDEAGWESLWVYDHFHTFPRKEVEATFEAWTMMATLAAITRRARIGQFVTCVQYREPSYLAKVAASGTHPDQLFLRVYGPDEPVDRSEPAGWTAVSPPIESDLIFDWLEIHINSHTRQSIDEIRIGTTWPAVTAAWASDKSQN